ncbi:putative Microsomal glutathione S-transferase 2 [Hypsibius exemplaris]|uniref:Microsomal glutathione S-transferase 2 n=1 Tax=Hypsibius exemplaris TaxID=2072580 RepID=A0A1W0X6M8_HYPEX|nr:putative Microsomal glutathione S-transferase 2 [Hypsibius exemplaris]
MSEVTHPKLESSKEYRFSDLSVKKRRKMKSLGSILQAPPKTITPETLYLVGLVTVASFLQMGMFLGAVGMARKKYKVVPPKIDGDPKFNLVYRAHQNSVENYPIFLAGLWTAAIFFHQVPAAIFGVIYMVGRELYFRGYSAAAAKRGPGFIISSLTLLALFSLTALGAASTAYHAYAGHHYLKGLLSYIPVPFT